METTIWGLGFRVYSLNSLKGVDYILTWPIEEL